MSPENHHHGHLPATPITYPNTNQGVVSAITVFGGGGRCQGDKCQITGAVSAYACAEISCPVWQLNGGCIEGNCPGQ